MKIVNLACGGLLALIVSAACGGKSNQDGGSNTNWFATCSTTAECGSGLECWCGVCTSPCATECDSGPAAATCTMPPAACAEPSEKHACAITCTSDAACKSLGAGATCVGSVCRKGTSGGGKVSCDERSAEASSREKALADGADRSCESNADCAEFPGVSCGHQCSIAAVSKAGVAAAQGQLEAIEEQVCKPFAAAGCKVIIPPCVFPGEPTCVSGKCEYALPGQNPISDGGAPASCADQTARITASAEDAARAADHACSTSADCKATMLVNRCLGGCTYEATSKSGAQTLENELSAMENQYCGDFSAAGCKVTILPCVAPPPVSCQNGKCALP